MSSAAPTAPGTVFARDYTFVRPLSEGGMGELHVVQQISTGALRALKLMAPQLVRDPKLRQRFEQEARVGARIESDHVVQVIGAGVDEATGWPWLCMELLTGEDLGATIDRRGALPFVEVRDVFAQITHAVAAAHRVGIVHRDLKPENIFLAVPQREGAAYIVKVLDFGIAKVVAEAATSTTQALGTPLWMAPEQTEPGHSIGPGTDVWALGLIAFRMLTGKHYWVSANAEGATPTMVLREVVIDPIVPATQRAAQYGCGHLLPPGFDAWFARCVARAPADRFENAGLAREAFGREPDLAHAATVARTSASPRTVPGMPAFAPQAAPGTAAPAPSTSQPAPVTPAPLASYTVPGAPFIPGPARQSVPASTPAGTYPSVPRPPAPSARRKSSASPLVGVALGSLVLIAAGGLGLRAFLRAQDRRKCESATDAERIRSEWSEILGSCRVACASEPERFCTTLGDLARRKPEARSQKEAARSYGSACDAGDLLGCRKLGSLHELGVEGAIEKDEALAAARYQKSCDGGNASGCAWLARSLERGRGIARDREKAFALFQKACAGDDLPGCAFLAFHDENRPIPRPDAREIEALERKAAPALRAECEAGGLVECVALGYLLQGGKGVAADVAAAEDVYRRACEGGLAEGCASASVLQILAGRKGAGNPVDALRKACSQGAQAACNDLAVLELNVPFALRQEQGTIVLEPVCGDALSVGCTQRGAVSRPAAVARDPAGAAALLQKACASGLGIACATLGSLDENGVGVPRDAAAAAALYEKACAAGSPVGCSSLRASPFKQGEVWSGSYTCAQGATDMALRIVDAESFGRVTAVFDFDFGHGRTTGRFLVNGAYDGARRSITFAAGSWIEQPANYMTVGLSGIVSLQGTVFAGKMDNPHCGAFRVVRQTSDMVDARCAEGSAFVEGHGCVLVPKPGPSVVGAWSGKGTETTGSSWPMQASIKSLEIGRCGEVKYPSLNCTGEWYCVKASDGTAVRAREIITSGQARCDTTGFIDLTAAGEWRWSSPGRVTTSTAHLERSGP